jgi:hypothetical protein
LDFDFVLKGRGFSRAVSIDKINAGFSRQGPLRLAMRLLPQPLRDLAPFDPFSNPHLE